MTLREAKSRKVVATQKLMSLEGVNGANQDSEMFIEDEANMLSVIEVDSIDKGDYILDVSIHRFMFLET